MLPLVEAELELLRACGSTRGKAVRAWVCVCVCVCVCVPREEMAGRLEPRDAVTARRGSGAGAPSRPRRPRSARAPSRSRCPRGNCAGSRGSAPSGRPSGRSLRAGVRVRRDVQRAGASSSERAESSKESEEHKGHRPPSSSLPSSSPSAPNDGRRRLRRDRARGARVSDGGGVDGRQRRGGAD